MSSDLNELLSVLESLAQVELAVAGFYAECAELWPKDREFWHTLVEEEEKHAAYLRKVAEMVRNKPGKFILGRTFHHSAISTFIAGIESNKTRLKTGKLRRRNAFFIARDMEQSLIEARYAEIIKSEDPELNFLLNEIARETRDHKSRLDRKISKL